MKNEFLTRNEEVVEGKYRLGAVIKRSLRSTVYETAFGEGALPAAIRIRERESAASNLMERWRNAMELAHPNLLKVYATGSAVLNGVPIVYIVMERADESLEGVLAERALTGSETREMLVPALAALRYLHKKGYAHSRLTPSNVLAVADQLKLSSDSAIRLGDGGSAAEDMRALGVLVALALTQKFPNGNGNPESHVFKNVPQPFADIVEHCLDPNPGTRWTVDQVEARLKGPGANLRTEIMPAAEVPTAAASEAEDRDEERSTRGIPKWIYAGLAALLLIVVLAAVERSKDSTPVGVVPSSVITNQKPAAGVPRAAVPESTAPEVVPAPVAASPPHAEASRAVPRGRKADGWSVIVAAYASREPAEKLSREMAKRWPKFNVSVFQPQAEKTHYIVVLGLNLSEDQAEALRKRAVQSGMPSDTYIMRVM